MTYRESKNGIHLISWELRNGFPNRLFHLKSKIHMQIISNLFVRFKEAEIFVEQYYNHTDLQWRPQHQSKKLRFCNRCQCLPCPKNFLNFFLCINTQILNLGANKNFFKTKKNPKNSVEPGFSEYFLNS